jgi:general secretion pathway protein N
VKALAWLGASLGGLLALALFAPAAWLAEAIATATGEQLLLAEARGTIWTGSAQLVLSGGPASRDAIALPGRLDWKLRPGLRGFELRARHPCCLNDQFRAQARPRIGGVTLHVLPQNEPLAQWPAAWLAGLGAPWNTLQPAGLVRVSSSHGLTLESSQGRLAFSGAAVLRLENLSSRLSTLPSVGSYQLTIASQAQAGESARLTLATLQGPLRLTGEGQWGGTGVGTHLRFRGMAVADPGSEAALSNLLNLIGRRQGATSVLTIG